jgi:hypothetical protein
MAQILDALCPVKCGLGGCETNPLQHRSHRNSEARRKALGKQSGLIETAFALFCRVQRNRNDRIERALAQSRIIERGDEPARDQMAKMNLPAVLEIENHMTRDAAASIGGDSGLEIKNAM